MYKKDFGLVDLLASWFGLLASWYGSIPRIGAGVFLSAPHFSVTRKLILELISRFKKISLVG